jgi:hypothetical protein
VPIETAVARARHRCTDTVVLMIGDDGDTAMTSSTVMAQNCTEALRQTERSSRAPFVASSVLWSRRVRRNAHPQGVSSERGRDWDRIVRMAREHNARDRVIETSDTDL